MLHSSSYRIYITITPEMQACILFMSFKVVAIWIEGFKDIFWQYFLNLFPGHYAAALSHLAAAHFIPSSHVHYSLFIFTELHLASINLGTSNHVYKQNQGCICATEWGRVGQHTTQSYFAEPRKKND